MAWVILFVAVLAFPAPARVTNDLATAEREGRELVRQLRELQPAAALTNRGTLVIRARKRERTELQFVSRIVPAETNWVSYYEAAGTSDPFRFNIEQSPGSPNRYTLNGTNLAAAEAFALPFAGSDFWLGDLGLEFLQWPGQLVVMKEVKRSQSCHVLESRPAQPVPGGYARVVSWIDRDTGAILQAHAYDANGKRLKEFLPTKVEKVNGRWELKEIEMSNLQTGSRTILTFDHATINHP